MSESNSERYARMRRDPRAYLREIIDSDTPYADYPPYVADAIRLMLGDYSGGPASPSKYDSGYRIQAARLLHPKIHIGIDDPEVVRVGRELHCRDLQNLTEALLGGPAWLEEHVRSLRED